MEEFRDLETLNHWNELCETRPEDDEAKALAKIQYHIKSRDNARTPMQWTAEPHAGFTSGQPWFRVNDTYTECNSSTQVGVCGSPFEHWAAVLRLRKSMADVFVYGDFEMVDAENKDVFAYTRSFNGETVLVVCNFRGSAVDWTLPAGLRSPKGEEILISTYGDVDSGPESVLLRPFEAFACIQPRLVSRL
jgi:glycosidase